MRTILREACATTVRRLRKKAGIAQEDLALEANIERAYMSALERGKHIPSLETIYKLLPLFGMSFAEFAAELDGEIERILKTRRPRPRDPRKRRAG